MLEQQNKKKVKIILIDNQLTRKIKDVIEFDFEPNKTVKYYLDKANITVDSLKYVNGNTSVDIPENFIVMPDSEIVVVPIIEGGHHSGKGILGAIASIGVLVTGLALPGMLGITSAFWSAVVTTAFDIGGILLINALFPPLVPEIPELDQSKISPTYGWDGIKTIARQGIPIPVLYGKMKLGGNVIAKRIDVVDNKQWLNVLLGLCHGKVSEIYDVKINNNDIRNYHDVVFDTRLGTNDQTAISYMNTIEVDNNQYLKLDYNVPFTFTTQGNDVSGIKIHLVFPTGLGYVNDKGGIDSRSVDFKIEYKKHSDTEWIDWGSYTVNRSETFTINSSSTKLTGNLKYSPVDLDSVEFHITIGCMWGKNEDSVHVVTVDSNGHVYGDIVNSSNSWVKSNGSYQLSINNEDVINGNKVVKTVRVYYTEVHQSVTIKGATKSPLRKTLYIENLEPDQYDIRITRVTPDSDDIRTLDDSYLTNIVEVVDEELIYPNLALLGIRALATDQLSGGLPNISCIVNRGYFASDDIGVVSTLYGKDSSNPAWAVYDILTNKLYGAGIDESRIDYSAFEEWANFCDENNLKVNIIFDSQTTIWDACLRIAMVGRGILEIEGTKFSVVIDKPSSPVQLFTVGNIIKDSFKETFLQKNERINYLEISFLNEEHNYERETFAVYTDDWNIGNEIKKSVTFYGVTNYDQALKLGWYMLNYNKYLTRTVEFEVDIDAIACSVGDVIRVQHDVPEWGKGGRIMNASTSYIELDREVNLVEGETYKIVYRLQNDTIVEKEFVAIETTTTNTINISLNENEVPQKYDIYTFGKVNYESKLFRIISITRSDKFRRKITAIEYNESIYTDTPSYTPVQSYEEDYQIHNLQAEEQYIELPNGQFTSRVRLAWDYSAGFIKKYHIYIKDLTAGSSYDYLGETINLEYFAYYNYIFGHEYEFKVVYEDYFGNVQSIEEAPSINVKILFKQANPSDVENFTASQSGEFVILKWQHVPDADVVGYQIREGENWDNGKIIVDKVTKNYVYWKPPLNGTYKLWIKAIDSFGNMSTNATSIIVTVSNIESTINVLFEQDDITKDPPADGEKENLVYYSDANGSFLAVPCGLTDTDVPEWTDQSEEITNYDGSVNLNASYTTLAIDFNEQVSGSIRIKPIYESYLTNATDQTYPDRTDETYPNDTDVHITSNVSVSENYFISDDDVTYIEKEYVGVSEETFRYLKTKVNITLDTGQTTFKLTNFKTVVDVSDKEGHILNQSISNSGTTFTLSDYGIKFYKEYYVGVTVYGNYYPVISNKTLDGFTVTLYDSSNNPVSGTVDIYLKGY